MIAVDVCAGGFFQIVFLNVGKNLLPASQVLNQAIKSLERSERHKRKDKPLLRVAVSAKEQSQEEGRQIGDQEQEVRDRLIPRHADGEIRDRKSTRLNSSHEWIS